MKKRKARKAAKQRDTGVMPATATAQQSGRDDWEAKDALRTLTRGHEIRSNKGLMKRVGEHARRESESLARVRRLEGKPL